ncbi:hypothetical protein RB595_001779 [Gaeumannomyces hyphopodioides]
MDDPDTSWPFWKFGLKKDDLVTTLQDQYNTIPSSIQDPEAFHHDVFELSHAASSTAEFHSLMSERKQQRLRELNDTLQSASCEIIANPSLIGTDQWQHAIQLFRTRSLDSLVRYFAAYLPDNHPWYHSNESSSSSSIDSDGADIDSLNPSEHMDDYDKFGSMSDESYMQNYHPLSPRSMTTYSTVPSQHDFDQAEFSLEHSCPMLFSSSPEADDVFAIQESCPSLLPDDASTQSTSDEEGSVSGGCRACPTRKKQVVDKVEKITIVDWVKNKDAMTELPRQPMAADKTPGSETPTPKSEAIRTRASCGAGSFFPELRPSRSVSAMPRLRHRDSAIACHLLVHAADLDPDHFPSTVLAERQRSKHLLKHSVPPSRLRRRDLSPSGHCRSRPRGSTCRNSSSNNGGGSRVQKFSSEPLRSRGRRREDC